MPKPTEAKNLPAFAGWLCILVGFSVLLSWAIDFAPLARTHFGAISMNPLTAVEFILSGACLLLAIRRHRLTSFLAGLIVLIALLKLVSFAGLDLKIDQLLFSNRLSQATGVPNRMAPNTAFNFMLIGMALLISTRPKIKPVFGEILVIAALLVSTTGIIGYLYSSTALTQVGAFIPIAFHTAILFLILCLGILLFSPDRGLVGVFNQKYAGAKVGRRVLPYALFSPIILGWLRIQGEKAGWFSSEAGASLMAMIGAVLGTTILIGSAHIVNLLEDRLEKKKVGENERRLNRLKRFFPPAIATRILSGEIDDPFKWHRNDVTVLFIDIRGFTHFAEVGEPEEVMNTLQEYYQTIAHIAQKHHASIGHLAGDGVMIFLNDPMPIENPQKNAVLLALEVRDALNRLCLEWNQKELNLNFGAGIASGYTTIGGIGAEGFWDYTVIGTAPNVASRLCSAARGGQILISRRFLQSVSDSVEVEDIGILELKGLLKPVAAYNIKGEKKVSPLSTAEF